MPTREDTFLVAFTTESEGDREAAEYELHKALKNVIHTHGITEWWIAEDDRRDGSDRDSALFVNYYPPVDVCEECGNDQVPAGQPYCTDCCEVLYCGNGDPQQEGRHP